ncbi:hypothetical protein GXW83_00475 [Streptacidiphilus sp. PB12-B1b]|uniref:hypothetical protein n=1 Tax=Streptacidiphilus sp. PB12-B1b TaxID=2705012 RepID=UPI0015FC711E|nr:hypothetical protein [Streptacidiphilus sp. PB12-B1b]QMU74490.1 hypothetical protein GXW83_00475 [Streptacidiphilus sp. PB12-B1b]
MTTEVADATAVQPPPSKPRPRGRTALIMAVAAVLGVLGGGAAGYAAQSGSAPTPLPPLSAPQPHYPAAHASAPALPAADDDMVRTDGDLTRLLVPVPHGATVAQGSAGFDSWLNIAQYAEGYVDPAGEFSWLSDHSFRRAAQAVWCPGGYLIDTVQLVQFSHAEEANALQTIENQSNSAATWAGSSSSSMIGSDDAEIFAGTKQHSNGSVSYYEGRGYGVHGDIAVLVYVQQDSPVSVRTVQTVLQDQLERL